MGQLLSITVEVKQLRDSVRLAQRRVNVHMAVSAPRREVLVPQFAEGDDLNDGLGVRPWFNRELVAARLAKDDHMPLALAAHQKFAFLARDLH